jgi:hypothetical protein
MAWRNMKTKICDDDENEMSASRNVKEEVGFK